MIDREAGLVLQKRYRIVAKLGAGGMGAVYKAEDVRLNNAPVAIKETFADKHIERRLFEREAAVLKKLHHRALPRVWDYFAEENGQFLVLDFIEGESLDKLLERQAAGLDCAQVMSWADVLLDTLAYIHAQDPPVILRDIKPANIRLTPRGEIFLLDFGLARDTIDPSDTTKNYLLGTRDYAPPEQLRTLHKDEHVDAQSDLYALGATLYHLLTGQPPIESVTREQRLLFRMPDPLHPTHEINPQIPFALAAVVAQAMAVERTRRFVSATEMREALQQARDHIKRQQWEEAEAARLREEAAQRRREERRQQEAAATERMQREEVERQQKEAAVRRQQEVERKQREEAERRRKEEAERQQREEAERKQKEEAERQQRAEAARREQEAAERRQREEAERKQRAAAERQQREEAERQHRADHERELAEQRRRTEEARKKKDPLPTPLPRRRQRLALLMAAPLLLLLGYWLWQASRSSDGQPQPKPIFEFETVRLDKEGKEVERRKGQARYFTEDLGNGVKLEMVEIPGGSFQM